MIKCTVIYKVDFVSVKYLNWTNQGQKKICASDFQNVTWIFKHAEVTVHCVAKIWAQKGRCQLPMYKQRKCDNHMQTQNFTIHTI